VRRKTRVVFVENRPETLGYILTAVEEDGFAIAVWRSTSEALKGLESGPVPDVLVLDLAMRGRAEEAAGSDYGGLEVARHIREIRNLRTPIVYLTALPFSAAHAATRELEGVIGREPIIVMKPAMSTDVLQAIRRALK